MKYEFAKAYYRQRKEKARKTANKGDRRKTEKKLALLNPCDVGVVQRGTARKNQSRVISFSF